MNINSISPPNYIKKYEFTYKHCYYILDSKESQIHIIMQNFTQMKTTSVVINNAMLDQHHTNIKDLRESIYKQWVHEGFHNHRILTHEQDSIIISFTYPNCTIKSLSFKCQWNFMDKSIIKVQQLYRQMVKLMKDSERGYQILLAKFQESMRVKFQKYIKTLQEKCFGLSNKLQNQAVKMMEQQRQLIQLQCQKGMKDERQSLKYKSDRCFDQLKLIKTELQEDIDKCNSKIQDLMNDFNSLNVLTKVNNDGALRQIQVQLQSQRIQEERSEHQDQQSLSAQQAIVSSQNSTIDPEHANDSQPIQSSPMSQILSDMTTNG